MWDKFGEFNSYKEINKAAEGQRAEGDKEALIELALENGIDKEDAEDYYDGAIEELCTPLIAAFGKLDIEAGELKPKDIMEDWLTYIRTLCSSDEKVALNVRKKGKSLKGCIGELLKWSFNHANNVDNDIIKAAGIKGANVKLGIPGIRQAHKIIREYYGG